MEFARRILRPRGLVLTGLVIAGVAGCRPTVHDLGKAGGAGGTAGAGGSSSGGNGGGGSGGSSDPGGTAGTSSGGNATGGSQTTGGTPAGGGGSGGKGGSGGAGGATTGGAGSGGGGSTAGGSGGTSTTPDAAVDTTPPPPSRGPTKATTGHNFPFPQNREKSGCIYPALYRNEDVQAIYTQWKNDTVTSDGAKGFRRVKRPNEPGLEKNSTVSEGIAYGMIIAVYMDDQALFDDLWQYEQQWLDGSGLMNWYINAAGSGLGSNPSGAGPASDADLDMAFALVMADKQWGGQGKLSKKYSDIALDQIKKVWANEFYDWKYLKPWLGDGAPPINLSYFAPAYHKIFAKIDTANTNADKCGSNTNCWKSSADAMYDLLNKTVSSAGGNPSYGLVPAWSDLNGKPNGGAFGAGQTAPTNYQYDSCRVPFRIGLDFCLFGESRAKDYVSKTSGFFSGTVGGATKMVDGYGLDGSPQAQYQKDANAQIQSAAFVGPAAVGAMSSASYQTFVNEAYAVLVTGKATVGGTYYDESWMVLSLLMMTGNFLDYTVETPAK